VAVLDRSDRAWRVVRALRELSRAGRTSTAVAVHGPKDRLARFVREADEAVEVERLEPVRAALERARPDAAWLGPAQAMDRAAFAEECERLRILPIGPPARVLRRLASPNALADLAGELGLAPAPGGPPDPRAHLVEVLVARDRAGSTRVLGVGDASVRAGDIAVLVESPSPALTAEREEAARAVALRAVTALEWVGGCAVQLLVPPGGGAASLAGIDPLAQSAPAIEEVSGLDLVEIALSLALGELLPAPSTPRGGHAVAARILAHDPEAGGDTADGTLELLRLPAGPRVRTEVAVEEGDPAPSEPRSMLATVIAHGDRRSEALTELESALADARVLASTSASSEAWLLALCRREELRAGDAGVGFLASLAAAGERLVRPRPAAALVAAAIEAYEGELDLERSRFLAEARRGRPRVGPTEGRAFDLRYRGERYRLQVRQIGPGTFRVVAGSTAADVRVERLGAHERRLAWAGNRVRVLSLAEGRRHLVEVDGAPHQISREPAGIVGSPMPAVVVAIPVSPGQRVRRGEPVARIESMKVEMVVAAPEAGVVREVLTVPNAQVDQGDPLLRIDPGGDDGVRAAPEPISLGMVPAEPSDPTDRYLAAIGDLRSLLLGFDVTGADARRLGARWRELAAAAGDGPAVQGAEAEVLRELADVQSLFSRVRPAGTETRPPLDELWRYLHEPARRGAGLSTEFLALLRGALSHYGLSLDEPGRELELALLRLQKAYLRADEAMAPVLAILERRLAAGAAAELARWTDRGLHDRLVDIGTERLPALADLAREIRYRVFDQPALERARAGVYSQAEADLDRLAKADAAARDAIVDRLVESPQPLSTLLVSRMAAADAALRPRLVEALLRRYYRVRALEPATARDLDGMPCAFTEYVREGRRIRVAACFAPSTAFEGALVPGPPPPREAGLWRGLVPGPPPPREAGLWRGLRALARLASETPAELDFAGEVYQWHDGTPPGPDELSEQLRAALATAGFARPVRRVSFAIAIAGRGLERDASQQHFTFFGGLQRWKEDRVQRGVHPMLFKRMQLGRLANFELERLPSVPDVYLYRAVAWTNPKDERLFAAAEVRDVTPVRDAKGVVVQLPQLERVLHEAFAGMRRFQAHRPRHQRLVWNRILLTVLPPLLLRPEELHGLAARLAPAAQGLGLEVVLIDARLPDPATGALRETLLRVVASESEGVTIRWDTPTDRPLAPMAEYEQRAVQLRRRGLTHPFEVVRMIAPSADTQSGIPRGEFVELELDAEGALAPVRRAPGQNTANIVAGLVRNFTERYPEGMTRVALLGDPSRAMGSLAEPECRRIIAALDLAERLGAPVEWFAVSAGANISMQSGTENMDWISHVLRRIVTFTQRGGELNVIVTGINVGAQPYWNAEATMLMHTRGILVMTPGSAMVLTGKEALEYSGSVSAEDNLGIGGYDRIMGPNGQAQYRARSLGDALEILLRHYEHCYILPGERFPRRAATSDPPDRDVRSSPHGPEGGAAFATVGDVFSAEKNPDRKKPFDIRRVMAAVIDQDHRPLERWRDLRGGETAVVWDAHLGGWPVCLLGIESRPLPRLEFVPADGPDVWSAGTLFPQSSKKIARAVNGASGNRPLVVLANLSGFDGSPESMRRLQLEYGAEIGRAVVNFAGPIVFCVLSRYHGGAFVVFSKTLREDIEVAAVEGARASVIGGAPAAAVVFAREVETRARKDPRVQEAEKAASQGGAGRARLVEVLATVRSEKIGEVAEEFDRVHTVERAVKVGSVDRVVAPGELRPYLVDAVERGIAREREGDRPEQPHGSPAPP
jgi:acetyl/propionyl-CoA carboxylase alpha subunit/acetyl-CoA carboxylase carboxyltransferase component